MGESVQTCMITHLPIQEGDQVVGLFLGSSLGREIESSGMVHSGDIFKIVSPLLFGTYDGHDIALGENLPARAMLDLSETTTTSIIRRRLTSQLDLAERPTLVLCHAEVWSNLATYRLDGQGEPGAPAAEIDAIHDLLELWMQPKDGVKVDGDWLYGTRMLAFLWEQEHPGRLIPYSAIFFDAAHGSRFISTELRTAMVATIASNIAIERNDVAVAMLAEAAQIVAADRAMNLLRRPWAPQPGVGTQHLSGKLHSSVAMWTANRANQIYIEDVTVEHPVDGEPVVFDPFRGV